MPETFLVCLGAQKAGTTWLFDYLDSHPDCHLPPVKEMHYFNALYDPAAQGFAEGRRRHYQYWMSKVGAGKTYDQVAEEFETAARNRTKGDLRSLDFLGRLVRMHDEPRADHGLYREALLTGYAGQPCVADITPDYCTLSTEDFLKIQTGFPDAKFLFLLRDPIDRTWSNLRMHHRWVREQHGQTMAFEELVQAYLDDKQKHVDERSDYGRIVGALDAAVPEDRRLYLFYEDLFSDDAMSRLCEFLRIPFQPGAYGKRVRQGTEREIPPAILSALRSRLAPIYADMVQRFGADLPSEWDRQSVENAKAVHSGRPRLSARGPSDEVMFFGIGAQRSGASVLGSHLRSHPEVFVPHFPELDFFTSVHFKSRRAHAMRRLDQLYGELYGPPAEKKRIITDDTSPLIGEICQLVAVLLGRAPYASLFRARQKGSRAFGEFSPSYSLLDKPDFMRMARQHPNARFIFMMRDPVLRFWSSIRTWWTTRPSADAGKSVQDLFFERLATGSCDSVKSSRYDRTITELEKAVPADWVFYGFSEDLFSQQGQRVLDDLAGFLGISSFVGGADEKVRTPAESELGRLGLTDEMQAAAREVFDPVYRFVADRFGDAAPKSWLWEIDRAEAREPALGSIMRRGV